jgi:hypothetical protein
MRVNGWQAAVDSFLFYDDLAHRDNPSCLDVHVINLSHEIFYWMQMKGVDDAANALTPFFVIGRSAKVGA